jgi:hypothetical protein
MPAVVVTIKMNTVMRDLPQEVVEIVFATGTRDFLGYVSATDSAAAVVALVLWGEGLPQPDRNI